MPLPAAKRVGDSYQQLKIAAAAALVPGQVMAAFGGRAGVVLGTINIAIGDPAVLALDGMWEIDIASGTTASAGDDAFYNTSTGLVVTAGGTNIIWIGVFAKAKTSGQTKATIALNMESLSNNPWVPSGAVQALSGAGAVNVTSYLTRVTTTGANALTLANGVRRGQLKKIQQIVDGGDGTLTPTSASGFTTVVFADVGDYVVLQWNGTAWTIVETGNDADGVTAPVAA
jgi:hypothetical protein